MARYLLAIDGGGSKVRARLVDSGGQILGRGTGGPANIRLGAQVAWGAVLAASRAALVEAGLGDDALAETVAGLGLAGACIGEARAAFLARPSPFARTILETDAHIACLGAHGGAPGAVAIVGTGSVAHVWDGQVGRQVGGWGFPISDGGSGAWIGLEAVRRAVASLDEPSPTSPFFTTVLARLGATAERAVHWADHAGPADYAALAPLVLDAAGANDAIAADILARAARHIDWLVATVMRLGAARIALLGGLAEALRPLLTVEAQAHLVRPAGDALDGALIMLRASAP